ncbi:hypothetical protein AB0J47_40745 [Nocardia sp. NPDC049737]|uniref:hypothetical protein n=1 Tax=Nocardia sp. NPDC049737 TaxID=3154358 RepID=UPI00341BE073
MQKFQTEVNAAWRAATLACWSCLVQASAALHVVSTVLLDAALLILLMRRYFANIERIIFREPTVPWRSS